MARLLIGCLEQLPAAFTLQLVPEYKVREKIGDVTLSVMYKLIGIYSAGGRPSNLIVRKGTSL